MYRTNISEARWIVYDIFGNIGWLTYHIVLAKCLAEKPEFMASGGLTAVVILAVLPALLMLVGLLELINERIHKLDYVLPKSRTYRGFGALLIECINANFCARCAEADSQCAAVEEVMQGGVLRQ